MLHTSLHYSPPPTFKAPQFAAWLFSSLVLFKFYRSFLWLSEVSAKLDGETQWSVTNIWKSAWLFGEQFLRTTFQMVRCNKPSAASGYPSKSVLQKCYRGGKKQWNTNVSFYLSHFPSISIFLSYSTMLSDFHLSLFLFPLSAENYHLPL